jgi:hypothetical protein
MSDTDPKLIGRVIETYSQCVTYRDNGTMERVFWTADSADTIHSVSGAFSTDFVRPNRLHFCALYSPSGSSIEMTVLLDMGRVSSKIADTTMNWASLREAMLGVSAPIGGSLDVVPCLLTGEVRALPFVGATLSNSPPEWLTRDGKARGYLGWIEPRGSQATASVDPETGFIVDVVNRMYLDNSAMTNALIHYVSVAQLESGLKDKILERSAHSESIVVCVEDRIHYCPEFGLQV